MKVVHELKTAPPYFESVWNGHKPFEIRKFDREYRVGDLLKLREWNGEVGYTGRTIWADILSVLSNVSEYGLMDGFCVIGICPFLTQSEQGSTPVGINPPVVKKLEQVIQAIKEQNDANLTAKVFAAMGIDEFSQIS
jgi:hypothetical protein